MDSATNNQYRFPSALVVMGVAGCGKSSVGEACAATLGWRLIEGDDYHSPDSIAKMRSGTPLTDDDRDGWLDRLGQLLADQNAGAVLTCSALRRRYRERLRKACPGLRFAFLELNEDAARARVAARTDHLFPPSLVASQFAALEVPIGEVDVLSLDATRPIGELVQQVAAWIRHADVQPTKDAQ